MKKYLVLCVLLVQFPLQDICFADPVTDDQQGLLDDLTKGEDHEVEILKQLLDKTSEIATGFKKMLIANGEIEELRRRLGKNAFSNNKYRKALEDYEALYKELRSDIPYVELIKVKAGQDRDTTLSTANDVKIAIEASEKEFDASRPSKCFGKDASWIKSDKCIKSLQNFCAWTSFRDGALVRTDVDSSMNFREEPITSLDEFLGPLKGQDPVSEIHSELGYKFCSLAAKAKLHNEASYWTFPKLFSTEEIHWYNSYMEGAYNIYTQKKYRYL